MKQTLKRMNPGRFLFALMVMLLLSMAFAKPIYAWYTSYPNPVVNTFFYDETMTEDPEQPEIPEQPADPDEPQEPEEPAVPSEPADPETPDTSEEIVAPTTPDTNTPAASTPASKPSSVPVTGVSLMAWDFGIISIMAGALFVIWKPLLNEKD